MTWLKQRARWVSDHLTGAGAVIVALVLALLGIVGNLTLARDLFGVQIGTTVVVGIGFVVLVGNLLYRANRRATDAEKERDDLRTQLDSRPDPAAEGRLFLRLYDAGGSIIERYFEVALETMPDSIPAGAQAYEEWFALCLEAIQQYRPKYALDFRASQKIDYSRYRAQLVKTELMDRWVDIGQKEQRVAQVEQARAVVARIIEDT